MKRFVFATLGLLILALAYRAPLAAHEGESHATAVSAGAQTLVKADVQALARESLPKHRHNQIVHFPIALGVTGVLFLLLGYRNDEQKKFGRMLLGLAFLASVAAYFTGHAQEEPFEEGRLTDVLGLHEKMGLGVAAGLLLGWILSFIEKARPWYWLYLIGLAILIVGTGAIGGVLAHS